MTRCGTFYLLKLFDSVVFAIRAGAVASSVVFVKKLMCEGSVLMHKNLVLTCENPVLMREGPVLGVVYVDA